MEHFQKIPMFEDLGWETFYSTANHRRQTAFSPICQLTQEDLLFPSISTQNSVRLPCSISHSPSCATVQKARDAGGLAAFVFLLAAIKALYACHPMSEVQQKYTVYVCSLRLINYFCQDLISKDGRTLRLRDKRPGQISGRHYSTQHKWSATDCRAQRSARDGSAPS
nr:uncharacterized protein LOC127483299 isoform X2 [Oryctolagus cuniculus]